jgi:hypothetical protein
MLFINQGIKKEEQIEQYINIKEYLEENKNELENRYFSSKNKPYFYWLAIRNLEEIEKIKNKKIIAVSSITRKESQWFSLSEEKNRYISSDILYLSLKQEKNIYYILGLLNSDFFGKYYNDIGIKKGRRIIFTQGFLSDINIPIIKKEDQEKISDITKNIILKLKENKEIESERYKIDFIINKYL